MLPFHREDNFFYEALNSVMDSKNVNFQVVLIDDRAEGASGGLNRKLSNYRNVTYVKNDTSHGYGSALKVGFQHCQFEKIALMNSDDLMSPYRLYKQILALENSGSDLNFAKMSYIAQCGHNRKPLLGAINLENFSPVCLLFGSYGADATWVMKRSWFENNFKFDNLDFLDWRIALNSFQKSKISFVNSPLYSYRKHASQITNLRKKQLDLFGYTETYNSWRTLAIDYGFRETNESLFNFMATPFLRPNTLSEEVNFEYLIHDFENLKENLPVECFKELRKILRRRCAIYVIQNISSYKFDNKMFSLSNLELMRVIKDFLYNSRCQFCD